MKKEEKENQKKAEDAPPEQVKKPIRRKTTAKKVSSAKKKETSKPAAQTAEKKINTKKTYYRVKFFYEWCKSCGICSALCPKNVILLDEMGRPYIETEDDCIGCRNCEMHCPDFAITVTKRYPERRKTNGSK